VFLLIPMVVWLLWERRTRRPALPAVIAVGLVGLALVPLVLTQDGHHLLQWIGEWPLSDRLKTIPQYYLTGYYGAALGHKNELLVALVIIAGLGLGLWRMLERPEPLRPALLPLSIAACGVLIPVVLVAFGADFLAPRNLVAAMIPVTALIAVVVTWPGTGRPGVAIAAVIALAFLAVSVDVDRRPDLQRENWRGLARDLNLPTGKRAITTREGFGTSTLEYYMPRVRVLGENGSVVVSEIDETGNEPDSVAAAPAPAPGFRSLAPVRVDGLVTYRFVSAVPRRVSERALAGAGHAVALGTTVVLLPVGTHASS
jgi:hypothetical protein